MKKHLTHCIIASIAALCAAAVIIGIIVYRKNHLSADDVGVTALMNEKIVSASCLCENPYHEHECSEDEVMSLLETLKNAVFRPVKEDNPNKDRYGFAIDLVTGKTESGKSFAFGQYGVVFEFDFEGEGRYYECSAEAESDYIQKYREVQGCLKTVILPDNSQKIDMVTSRGDDRKIP